MTYKRIPLYDVVKRNTQLKELLEMPMIKESLQAGGTIAGGFVRQVLKEEDLFQYLASPLWTTNNEGMPFDQIFSDSYKPETIIKDGYRGDIDIFFENESMLKQVVDEHARYKWIDGFNISESMTGLCANICYDPRVILGKDKINGRLKIQLVSEFYGDAEGILETFDFLNTKCAIDSQWVYYMDGFFELEKSKTLEVVNSSGPLLGSRILKYMNARGLSSGITPKSHEAVTEWVTRYSANIWGEHPLAKMAQAETFGGSIMQRLMQRDDILQTSDLVLLIGKFVHRVPIHDDPNNRYSDVIGFRNHDIAVDLIGKRGGA